MAAAQPRINPHVFREYDIRGLVDPDLTPDFARLLGRAFGTTVREAKGKKICLGRDCRTSSDVLHDAFAEGVRACGVDIVDIGVVPTPLTYFAAHTLPVDGLAMITGSHNPAEYNGFKLGVGKSTFHGSEIQALRARMERGDFVDGKGELVHQDVVEAYRRCVRENLKLGSRRPRVVIDAGNGTGGVVAVPLFESLGFTVVPLFCEMDGRFPNHHPDPTVEENLEALKRAVREQRADVGIAYDGDADRVGAIDEKGNVLWGDQLMILFSRELLKEMPGATIVAEVKCSKTLFDDIAAQGGKPIMWKAGHSLIKAKMKETGAALAGEMSGHIFFAHRFFGFDDGIYASARLLEILSRETRPFSQLLADVPKTYSTPELRAECPEEKKFRVVEAVKRDLAAKYSVIDVDGVRVTFPDGWGLVRASNTQPLLVLRFEAETKERLAEIRALVESAVERALRTA